jgi:hypothetical protein
MHCCLLKHRIEYLLSSGTIQSYIPEINETNWRRQKGQSTCSNLNIRRNIHQSVNGNKLLNVTKQMKGLQKEQNLMHEMLKRLRSNFCERVEITPLCKFTTTNTCGIKCQNKNESSCRYLDLKTMLKKCCEYLIIHTQHWQLDPIVDYYTLNVAACLATSHASLTIMSNATIQQAVRAQHCQIFVYLNQLLRTQKSGRLYKQTKEQLSRSVIGYRHNRELMLPFIPNEIYICLSALMGVKHKRTTVVPTSIEFVKKIHANFIDLVTNRIYQNSNKTKKNRFDLNILKCEGCCRLFFGGRGENDIRLFQEHLQQYPSHCLPSSNKKISSIDWANEFRIRQKELKTKYDIYYSVEQRRAYDAAMRGNTSTLVLMGVAGSGKSTLVQDLRYLLECIFWKKDEIALCGTTNAIAQRMSLKGLSFHRFLGLRPLPSTAVSIGNDWNLSVDHCLMCMRKEKRRLKTFRVVILEEGLELQSNILEAYFRYINEINWDVITIINGDPCQGNYRQDENRESEFSFFAKSMLNAEICPNMEVCTFTEDLRTKNVLLREAKTAVRNAKVTPDIFKFLQQLQYSDKKTPVDIILCTHIRQMNDHNRNLLAANPNGSKTYIATSTILETQNQYLTYKNHGVLHELILKKDAPIIISYDVEVVTNRGDKVILRNGTTGKVVNLLSNSIKVALPILGGIIAEVKPVLIYGTSWTQIPVFLAYAATISKCIGFEFDSVAVDFGLQGRTEAEIAMQSNALWRRKMAYTAITRAKQQVYFVGPLHINIFNNMDKMALDFFNSKASLSQAKMKNSFSVGVVRDVQELKEFWIQSSKPKPNATCIIDNTNEPSAKKPKFDVLDKHQKVIACINGRRVEIYAQKYPRVLQHIHGQGHLVIGTSIEYQDVILKVPSRRIEQQHIDAEYRLLSSLKDVPGVLHVLAKPDQHPTIFVLEGMKNMVPWKYFRMHANADAKQRFKNQLQVVLREIHTRQKVHGNISKKSALTNMLGDVKLTWFQHDVQFCPETVQQDLKSMHQLCRELMHGEDDDGSNLEDKGGGDSDDDDDNDDDNDNEDEDDNEDDDDDDNDSSGDDEDADDDDDDDDNADDADDDESQSDYGNDDADHDDDDDDDTYADDADDDEDDDDDNADDADDADDDDIKQEETFHDEDEKTKPNPIACGGKNDNVVNDDNGAENSNQIEFDGGDIKSSIELFNISTQKNYTECSDVMIHENWSFFDNIVLLCLQGCDGAFNLSASLNLWRQVHPAPEVKHYILNQKSIKEINYGSTFQLFVHPSIWNAAAAFNNYRLISLDHSFVIHIGVKLNICPVALDAMFRQRLKKGHCCENIPKNEKPITKTMSGAWLPEILLTCWPSEFQNISFCILQMTQDKHIQVQMFQCKSETPDTHHRDIKAVVLKRFGNSYTLLDVDINLVLQLVPSDDVQYFYLKCCTSLNSIMVSQIQLPTMNSTKIATHDQFKTMWEEAIKTVDLTQDCHGRWTTKPPGLNGEKRLQDGSLQFSGWLTLKNKLFQISGQKRFNVVDFGSEGGYCIAQFAIDPLVKSATGKEIQYPWVAYSALILCSMFMQSKSQNTHFAGTQLLFGSFLDICDTTWMTAVACADIIHCDNWNWWKSNLPKMKSVIPKNKGNSNERKSTDSNVAFLMRRIIKDNAFVVVYMVDHFQIGFKSLLTFNACANWNTVTETSINILQLDGCYSSQSRFTMQVSSNQSDEMMISKDLLTRHFFQCDCKMQLIYFGRIAARDTHICASCQVLTFFLYTAITSTYITILQKCMCNFCSEECHAHGHRTMTISDVINRIRELGWQKTSEIERHMTSMSEVSNCELANLERTDHVSYN